MKSISRVAIITFVTCIIVVYFVMNYLLHLKFRSNFRGDFHVSSFIYDAYSRHIRTLGENKEQGREENMVKSFNTKTPYHITVAVVACGDRLAETLVMLKSAIVFTSSPLKFIIMSDDDLIPSFKEKMKEWKSIMNDTFTYEILPINFPLSGNTDEWRRLFKPCASQRLFFPTVLKDVESVLYVDTDTLFLGPLEDVWRHFQLMNSSQVAALSPEHEDPNVGWYNRFARHPYYGKLGVNSGVMLMNLTRMRDFGWTDYVVPIYKEYKLKITWGDQDIINIIFHFHPDKLYIYPCRYNYRPDHCMYMSVCKSAEKDGVAVLHGSRSSFHAEKQPPFRAVYRAIEEYQLGTDPFFSLYLPMKNYLDQTSSTSCGKIRHIFIKTLEKYFDIR